MGPRYQLNEIDFVGDSYDNALAEAIIGLYKTEITTGKDLCAATRTSSSPPT